MARSLDQNVVSCPRRTRKTHNAASTFYKPTTAFNVVRHKLAPCLPIHQHHQIRIEGLSFLSVRIVPSRATRTAVTYPTIDQYFPNSPHAHFHPMLGSMQPGPVCGRHWTEISIKTAFYFEKLFVSPQHRPPILQLRTASEDP